MRPPLLPAVTQPRGFAVKSARSGAGHVAGRPFRRRRGGGGCGPLRRRPQKYSFVPAPPAGFFPVFPPPTPAAGGGPPPFRPAVTQAAGFAVKSARRARSSVG